MRIAGRRARAGFSLIELLVVIAIIVLVISLIVPALGRVRDASKKQDTRNLVAQLTQAMQAFQLDKKRLPGYFSQAEMGLADNATRGFSQSQNIMLDLGGGIVSTTGPGTSLIGPMNDTARQVRVDPSLIGTGAESSYFSPSARYFKKQNQVDGGDRAGVPEHALIPELVDAFGTPILVWMADNMASGGATQSTDFARDAWALNQRPARFYWNSNAAFLTNGVFVGDKRVDQGNAAKGSLLASNITTRSESLVGMLGNPTTPLPNSNPNPQITDYLPAAPRGSFVVQSAGVDGVYLSRADAGGKLAINGTLYYGLNFKAGPLPGTTHTDSSGNARSIDVVERFDDVIQGGS
ncbi:MAG: prepilin-type N-terminal cleavage/methylation domain-containing protein [Planctomycetota bacterium]|nr:prepilin-type N-terminal cleavage/methylation domain-containing protein [Planctomycetota bacterium]